MINAVIFDVDDTLYDQQAPFNAALGHLFPQATQTIDFDFAYKRFRDHSDETFCRYTSGEWTLKQMRHFRIDQTLQDCGFKGCTYEKSLLFQKTYNQELDNITLLPDVEELLTHLATLPEVKVGIVTNGPTDHQYRKIVQLDVARFMRLDDILISEATGFAKPQHEIFDLAAKEFNLIPEQTLYVGDNFLNDVIGAKSAGWRALWFNHRQRTVEKPPYQADSVANTFEELPACILNLLQPISVH